MRQKLFRTINDIETLGLTIPKNSFVVLKYRNENTDSGYYEFLGLFSGLSKILYDNDVIFDSYAELTYY